jgi:hypothetical protein
MTRRFHGCSREGFVLVLVVVLVIETVRPSVNELPRTIFRLNRKRCRENQVEDEDDDEYEDDWLTDARPFFIDA